MENISNQEELVLLSVGALYPDAYAYAIKEEIKKESGKNMSLGTIHTILYRLENEGLLKSKMGGSSSKRGGRSKRLFSLTAKGYQMAEDLRKLRQSLWSRISPDQISL